MIHHASELRALLQGTCMAASQIATLPVLDTGTTAFALEVSGDSLACWNLLRDKLALTGRWPVLAASWQNPDDKPWAEQMAEADYFSRFYFAEEAAETREGHAPAAIIAAAEGLDIVSEFEKFEIDYDLTAAEYAESERDNTRACFGCAPEPAEVKSFLQGKPDAMPADLDRWFFDWELQHCADPLGLPEDGLCHIDWYEPLPGEQALLLLPTEHGWEAPAYLNWFASYHRNSQFIVALLREWYDKYGAELVAHHGTMLHFITRTRPQTAEEAWHLAWQQTRMASCTITQPGATRRDHARALLHTNRWFLHERP